jgi:hypothetical protein
MKKFSIASLMTLTMLVSVLMPYRAAEGGEFLKRLFSRKCRTVCVSVSPSACIRDCCQIDSCGPCVDAIYRPVTVCPHQLQLEVRDGTSCVMAVYSASDCNGNYFGISMPCNVTLGNCAGRSCVGANNNMVGRLARPTFTPDTGSHFDEGLAAGITAPNAATISLQTQNGATVANTRICSVVIDGVLKMVYLADVTLENGRVVGIGIEVVGGTAANCPVVQVANEGYLRSKLLKDTTTQRHYFVTLSR